MAKLTDYSKQITDLRNDMLATLNDFFNKNQSVTIDAQEVLGCSFCVRGDVEIHFIDHEGVHGEEDYDFDDMDLIDLDYVISVINDYLSITYRPKEKKKKRK